MNREALADELTKKRVKKVGVKHAPFAVAGDAGSTRRTRRVYSSPKTLVGGVPAPAAKSRFGVIFTYENLPQETIDEFSADKGLPVETFLERLFQQANLNVDELEQLEKISVCQIGRKEDAEPWLEPSRGKFFFNAQGSANADTIRWDTLRKQRIAILTVGVEVDDKTGQPESG